MYGLTSHEHLEAQVDDLMMNLFSLIADQVRDRQELFDDEGRIMEKLMSVGYHLHEADAALTLMQELVTKQDDTFFGADDDAEGMRTMNSEERARFTIEAFSFAVKLGHLGVISEDQREEILEKAMNLNAGRIEIGHMKLLVAHLLVTNLHEHDEAAPAPRRKTVWN